MPLYKRRYLFYFQQTKSLSNKKSFGQFKGEYKIIFQHVTKSYIEQ